ncbi:MAG: GNAT family N-acetyltransferase [bacterium]|nr:GNAT family N-acetyltransferase [candidate division KSB1 bacterium]MDH7559883.1 GNAT family N-acetyltransferase [bacterium]
MPTLSTARLILRPFRLDDAPVVRELAGAREVAATTTAIPHPYGDGVAEQWIATHQQAYDNGQALTLAITLRDSGKLIGAIHAAIDATNKLAELGYWVGRPYWNQGYCTDAAKAMVDYAFRVLGMNRVQARHMTKNPASGRVTQRIGMRYEGTLRQSLFRWGTFEDAAIYAILREEWSLGQRAAAARGEPSAE